MPGLQEAIANVSRLMSRTGGLFLLMAACLVSFEILARKFFYMRFGVGTELSTYALAVGASWSFAHALLQRAHVRIDVLRRPLPDAVRKALDLLALTSLVAFGLILSWHVWGTVRTSWDLGARENTPLGTALVIPQAMWFWGIVWFTLVAAIETVRAGLALARRRTGSFYRIAAPLGVEDELDEALAKARAGLERDS